MEMALEQGQEHSAHNLAALRDVYDMYAQFGDRGSTCKEINNHKFAKLCRECKIMVKGVTTGKVDIAFQKSKPGHKRTLSFDEFLYTLALLAPQRFPRDPSPVSKIGRCIVHYAGSQPRVRSAVVQDSAPILHRLTDSELYTGASAHRFDKAGRGRGLAGRDSIDKGGGALTTGDGNVREISQILRTNMRGGTGMKVGNPRVAVPRDSNGLNDKQIRQLFASYDEDDNGVLDIDEVSWLCEDLGLLFTTEQQMEEALYEMEGGPGVPHDAQVDADEFVRWWRSDPKSKQRGSLARQMADSKSQLLVKEMDANTPLGRMLEAKHGAEIRYKASQPSAQAASPKPTRRHAHAHGGSIYDKLTDASQYTGAHRARFDQEGRGRGLAGRDTIAKGGATSQGVYMGGAVTDLSQITRTEMRSPRAASPRGHAVPSAKKEPRPHLVKHEQEPELTMENVFEEYVAFGGRDGAGEMTNAQFSKLCRESKITGKLVAPAHVDLVFEKCKTALDRSSIKRTLNFEQFNIAVSMLALQRYPRDSEEKAYSRIVGRLITQGGPDVRTMVDTLY